MFVYRQARIVVLPVSMNGYIICSLSVLVLYPTLVVRSITRPTLHPQTRTHSFPPNAMLNGSESGTKKADVVRTFRGVKFFFW